MANEIRFPFRFFCSVLLLLPLVQSSATVIVQKNGDVISGKILEEKADKYVFQSPYGTLQIAKTSITKLILDEKTIELKDVEFKNKKVKARLVSEENNTAVYLTEDGQTIRKEQAKPVEVKPVTENKTDEKPADRQKFLIGVTGSYGLSTFQQVDTGPSTGGPPPLEQGMHLNTLGVQASGHYALFSWLGLGAGFSFYRWSGTASLVPQQPQQLAYDALTANTTMAVTGSVLISLLGHLGDKSQVHDLRAELAVGAASNTANMELTFKNPPQNFPSVASAGGKNKSVALQAQLYYTYSFSASLRLRLGVGYYRAFYTNIYDSGLQGNPPIPSGDKFKADFDRLLALDGQNPQIISLQLGAEFGF